MLLLQALEGVVDQAFADVQPCTFAPGVTLIQEGEVPDGLLLVSSGVVQASWEGLSAQEGPLLGPGSVLGDISFLLGGVARASVIACEPVEARSPRPDGVEPCSGAVRSQGFGGYQCPAFAHADPPPWLRRSIWNWLSFLNASGVGRCGAAL